MLKHLKDQYGFNSFRSLQRESIDSTIENRDSIVLFPTGGGKSLCYQFPSTYLNKITVVVSPLISLMTDQQHGLTQMGIKSIALNSSNVCSDFEIMGALEESNVIYCTPEYLTGNISIIDILKSLNVCMFAIDEAHCLSEWGHDFRPSYRKLSIIREEFPDIPIAAFTATATPRVTQDIAKVLNLNDVKILQKSSRRPNLKLMVCKKTNMVDDLLPLLSHTKDSTIIYVQTRDMTEKITAMLLSNGISAAKYHAGMSNADRHTNHTAFISDTIRILVATVSFGMGIDKSDIRTVIIYGASTDIETYYQEVGRAGRDGVVSNGILFHANSDFVTNRLLLSKSYNSLYRNGLLTQFKQYIDGSMCRQYMIECYFSTGKLPTIEESGAMSCLCDNCACKDLSTQGASLTGVTTDLTAETKLIVGLVKELRLNYGASKLILTLIGSAAKMLSPELSNSRYHGLGHAHSVDWWKLFIELLVQNDYLVHKLLYNKFQLVAMGTKIIVEPVMLVMSEDMNLLNVDQTYLILLRGVRADIARQDHVAPYMVLSDAVLLRIAQSKPQTIDKLKDINGITKAMIDKHGSKFINIKATDSIPTRRESKGSVSSKESLALFCQGKTLPEIAKHRSLKLSTIENHITTEWTLAPYEIDCERIGLTQDIYDAIISAINTVGKEKLKPIKDALPNNITYFQIKTSLILMNEN